MGLGLVLVGHVNFLLGALVHGAVLRHINVHSQARTMVYATSNVLAIVAGLMVSENLQAPLYIFTIFTLCFVIIKVISGLKIVS